MGLVSSESSYPTVSCSDLKTIAESRGQKYEDLFYSEMQIRVKDKLIDAGRWPLVCRYNESKWYSDKMKMNFNMPFQVFK